MSRKYTRFEFLKLAKQVLAATGLTIILGPVIAYFYPKKLEETPTAPVLVGPDVDFPVGESKTVAFGRYPALVIKTEKGLKSYSAVCTHFACIVMWEPESNQIVCPCHAGFFKVEDGSVISGPPASPLAHLNTEIIDGNIYVKAGGEE
jgi:Rieske Fe-S protein